MNKRKVQYSPNKLARCLSDIREGVLTQGKAAKAYGIPRSTITCKLNGIRPEGIGKCGPEAVLGAENEDQLVSWVIDNARRGFPITKQGLLFSVKTIIEKCDLGDLPFSEDGPGIKWYKSFKKRHPIISEKKSEYLSLTRAKVTEEGIRNWFQKVAELLPNLEVLNHPDRLYNLDESCFFLNSNGRVVLAEKGKPVYDINSNCDKENITVSFCANAAGEWAPTLVLYKYLRIPKAYKDNLPPDGWSIGGTESGWMNSEAFYEYFANVFIPYIREKMKNVDGDRTVVVFFDGHRSHLTLPVSQLAYENNVHLVCLPPSTTHMLQPLDVSIFKALKTYWVSERDLYEAGRKRNIEKYEVPIVIEAIFRKYGLKTAIVNGFKRCGLYPFDANAVDYTKIKNFNLETNESAVNETPNFDSKSNSILDYFESKINNTILRQFRSTLDEWNGRVKYEGLFEVWKDLRKDDTSYFTINTGTQILDLPVVGVEEVNNEITFLNHEPSFQNCVNSTIIEDIEIATGSHNYESSILEISNIQNVNDIEVEPQTSILNSNPIAEIISEDSNRVPDGFDWESNARILAADEEERMIIESNENNTDPFVTENQNGVLDNPNIPSTSTPNSTNSNESMSLENNESVPKQVSLRSVLDGLSKADFTPSRKKVIRPKSTSYLPVITHSQWRKLQEAEQVEKEALEEQKEARRKEREEKVEAKNKKKKELELKRAEKRQKRDTKINTKKSKVKCKPKEKNDDLILAGSYVIVNYKPDNQNYPGILLSYDENDDEYEVKTMEKILYGGKTLWKWPAVDDILYYEKDDVLKTISEPIPFKCTNESNRKNQMSSKQFQNQYLSNVQMKVIEKINEYLVCL